MPASKSSRRLHRSDGAGAAVLCFVTSAAIMAGAVLYFYKTGATLYSGDAESHLNIARRIVDSRTPGWNQIGTTWLPLPHLLMTPLVRNDYLWRTGLAGAAVSGLCTALATAFLFAGVARVIGSRLAAGVAAGLFLLNPNTLYLGAVPMTEPVFFAALFGLFFFTVRFAETSGWGAVAGASLCALAGTLTRYEGWFLLPFGAAYIWLVGRQKRRRASLLFCAVAGAGPALWLAHNRWYFGDPFYFYRGPWSPRAIQRGLSYPGNGNWRVAAQYYFEAVRLIAGWPAVALAGAGSIAALIRRNWWPVALFLLPSFFYIWSMRSSGGTPIYVPTLEPHSWYNIRYGMVFLPLIAFGGAALARFGRPAAAAVMLVAFAPLALQWREHAITLQETEINSRGRREWTAQAVSFLQARAGPNETFFTSFNDMTAIYRTLGIPLRDTLTGDNDAQFLGACSRPDLFLREDWAVAMGGDEVQSVVDRARLRGPHYEMSERIIVKGQPVLEIYHRTDEHPLR